ncbi:zinc finger protein 185 [Eleutherodactylus coqui]|uniref:LIM zinc-binding domain-containing protein n=1 Tax=Eleutherodactylus coqui TaxID=57060 RepID=A0A8J6K7H4_ELECQ|nr:hypothetical protein GDO78_013362 [Eleutherodactylus coqui]KAG9478324.1 hypothetical protein GDO78_013362 [Eleutherodactylus coqui]
MSSSEADRKNILKQMKVRTTYKKDKSWIHQENSEDERDNSPSPLSPQLKALEGRMFNWSPNSDSSSERNSGTFRAKEVFLSSSPPASSSNKQFSYSSNETNKSVSATSQPSTQPSTVSHRLPSYIIRGQPVNAVSQARGSPSSNGYKNSYSSAQPRTSNSLPRVPNATGHRMSTEEYKKLAPYNVKNRSSDVSDDETLYTPREQDIRTEQASSVLRSTSSRDRSYVLSAAKRNSGTGVQETSAPFVAKRVQIEEEETSPRKSETLPKTLSSYLYDDNKRFENHWKETQANQATSPTPPSRLETSNSSSGPKLTSYSTSNTVENQSSARIPEPGKITVVTEGSNNNEKDKPKPAAGSELPAPAATTRKERVETKKCDLLPDILAAYLYDDINSFEKGWKPKILPQSSESTSQTVTTRETGHSESPRLTSWSTNIESKTVKPEPATITVLRDESPDNKESSEPSVESRSMTRTTDNTDVPDSLKLPSSSLPSSVTESTQPRAQARPGRLSHITDERDADNSKVSNRSATTTTTTTRTRITTETRIESRSPRPAPRMETKPKEDAEVPISDLISWTDVIDNSNTRIAKEAPTPVPRQSNKDSDKSTGELPLTIVSPELNSTRTNQPIKPAVITEVEKTGASETRYRVSESLDESEADDYDFIYNQLSFGNRRLTDTTSDTQSERPGTPEQRSSSPRPTPRPRESISSTVTESEYRLPETLEDTMLEAGPSRSSSRSTVTTTRSTVPSFREYVDNSDNRSVRSVSSTRSDFSTTTMETQYENPLAYEASQYDAQSSSSKGVLFVKEYVNSRESMKSPTTTGSISDFSDDLESIPFSSNSSYLYSSATLRTDEGPCTYCGREIKDCPKIILEHLNIYCHEYCFKCGICHKPMGDLTDSLFIHRDVVHCESCYEKLF